MTKKSVKLNNNIFSEYWVYYNITLAGVTVLNAKSLFFLSLITFFISSCASFLKDEDITRIKSYEKGKYILQKELEEGEILLKKGEEISLYIRTSDNFIKVYCYPSTIDFLKAERTLILYLFEDDFSNNEFDIIYFENTLFNLIERKK